MKKYKVVIGLDFNNALEGPENINEIVEADGYNLDLSSGILTFHREEGLEGVKDVLRPIIKAYNSGAWLTVETMKKKGE